MADPFAASAEEDTAGAVKMKEGRKSLGVERARALADSGVIDAGVVA